MMKRRRERIFWMTVVGILSITIALILLAPTALAQSNSQNNLSEEYIQELESVFYTLQNHYVDQIDPQELFEGAMKGLFETLDDPYSLYFDDEYLENLTDTTEGKYGGVGLYISVDYYDEDNPNGRLPYVRVVSPIEDTPSWRAGINAGDYIYAIEGESAEGFSTSDVSSRLRGVPGTQVNVTMLRDKTITFDLVLTREEIEIPTVKHTVINDNIAYLRIIEFTPFTSDRVEDVLEQFAALGLKKLIVDVRSNPGGLLDSVIDVADLFFSDEVVVSTRYRQSRFNQVHKASPGKKAASDMKIAVLIDRGSASASEILTGVFKDHGRATVIGETSYGKGSIQQILPLRNNQAAIKLTTGRYYTPSGKNIDKTGIEPDIEVPELKLSEEQTEAYTTLLQENRIGAFVDQNPRPSPQQVSQFMSQLQQEGLDPGERTLRLMIKRESQRRLNVPSVVDLEFDRILIRAIEFLDTNR